jgi:hypothetical protein
MQLTRRALTAFVAATIIVALPLWAPAQGPASDPAKMTTEQMVKAGGEMVQAMEDQLSKAFKLLEESITSGDVAATQARNEAITAMKGLVKLSEENFLTLQQRAAEGDKERVEHEYVKISIAAAKVQELFAQVQTAGGIQVDIEATGVETSLDIESDYPIVPELTEVFYVDTAEVLPDPPPFASPYF